MISRVFTFAVSILAVDHFGLLWMKHQPTFGKPPIQGLPQHQGLTLAATVTNGIVSIPFERHARKPSSHPRIERVMQEQVG